MERVGRRETDGCLDSRALGWEMAGAWLTWWVEESVVVVVDVMIGLAGKLLESPTVLILLPDLLLVLTLL